MKFLMCLWQNPWVRVAVYWLALAALLLAHNYESAKFIYQEF